jgi:hypothetical protein
MYAVFLTKLEQSRSNHNNYVEQGVQTPVTQASTLHLLQKETFDAPSLLAKLKDLDM